MASIRRSNPPKFLFMQTNQRCNLKCTHCSYWLNDDSDSANYLSREQRIEFLTEFKKMGGQGMVTCGGEPMLDLEEYFALTSACRRLELRCLSVVNGTRIHNRQAAERMLKDGPSEITISLDHWNAEDNDRLRGVKGAHLVASKAVQLLVEARAKLGYGTPINVMTILSEDTWPTLEVFFNYVLNELGADKLKLNLIQPTFQGRGEDAYFSGSRVKDVDGCVSMIRWCDSQFGIKRSLEWLSDVEMYLRSVRNPLMGWNSSRGTERAICNSYDRNIMLDLYGNARLCFSTLFPDTKLTPKELKSFWFEDSIPIRNCMVGCKQYCGISHSVRRSESTVKNV
jgi:MoaA/NifB/PqqE/SkfB family radical SAM enzyme